jgi:hypothetical protein
VRGLCGDSLLGVTLRTDQSRRVGLFTSAVDVVVDLLQSKRSRKLREERRIKRERIEEKVGARDHCR